MGRRPRGPCCLPLCRQQRPSRSDPCLRFVARTRAAPPCGGFEGAGKPADGKGPPSASGTSHAPRALIRFTGRSPRVRHQCPPAAARYRPLLGPSVPRSAGCAQVLILFSIRESKKAPRESRICSSENKTSSRGPLFSYREPEICLREPRKASRVSQISSCESEICSRESPKGLREQRIGSSKRKKSRESERSSPESKKALSESGGRVPTHVGRPGISRAGHSAMKIAPTQAGSPWYGFGTL